MQNIIVAKNKNDLSSLLPTNIFSSPGPEYHGTYSLFWTTTSILTFSIALAGYYYYKNAFAYWKRKGLRGPRPVLIFGTVFHMAWYDRKTTDAKWLADYGKVYGLYRGTKPTLMVADAEVLRQIAIKDFDVFPNHDLIRLLSKFQNESVFAVRDDKWRRIRATMSPTFTSGKIKRMFKLLDVCADDLLLCLEEQLEAGSDGIKGSIINIGEIASLYTMDGIASCCYGLKLDRHGAASRKAAASRSEFVAMAENIFRFSWWRLVVGFAFSENFLLRLGFEIFPSKAVNPLERRVKALMQNRRHSKKKYDDYLQLLLDAKLDDEMTLEDLDAKESHHVGLTRESMLEGQKELVGGIVDKLSPDRKALTEDEILYQAIFLLIVGLDTTSVLVTQCIYALTFHPQICAKLHEELIQIAQLDANKMDDNKFASTRGRRYKFEYSQLTSCVYLDAVISETLRLLSPVFQTDRVSNRDYYIEKYNLHLPAGSKLTINLSQIMSDPDYWPEPLKFDPSRFLPGNVENIVPGSYCPFGLGPRHCLGMRFSLVEAKLAVAKIVMNYKLERAPGTSFPPKPKFNLGFNQAKNPIVKMISRS